MAPVSLSAHGDRFEYHQLLTLSVACSRDLREFFFGLIAAFKRVHDSIA